MREHTDDSTDETVIQMGVHLCRELEEGRVSQRDAVAWLMNEYPDDISVIPTITIFGIEALCPEWYR